MCAQANYVPSCLCAKLPLLKANYVLANYVNYDAVSSKLPLLLLDP